MKSTLIRVFTILTLATSISAFGLSEKPATTAKTNSSNANCETTGTPAKVDRSEGQSGNSQERTQKQRLIEEQEKQWLHDVQNIVAG